MSVQDFDFNMARAITEQLVEQFGRMSAGELSPEAVLNARSEPGVYLLFLDGDLVYVGKSDRDLRGRLERHRRTLIGRKYITIDQIAFKAIHIHPNWSALTTEASLIRHYRGTSWNTSGFGSNDPGRNRDLTAVPADSFDGRFPIDPDFPVEIRPGQFLASELLGQLKAGLPYLLRYQQLGTEDCSISFEGGRVSARVLLQRIASQLGDHWQVTALPGRILMYRERQEYPHGEVIWPLDNRRDA